MAKELDLEPVERLFGLNLVAAEQRGKTLGSSVLQELGGLPAIAGKLPLDRGETNRAMFLLCLRLSDEMRSKNAELADKLRDAAMHIASDTRMPGSKSHADTPYAVVDLLSSVWPLLNLAVIPENKSLESRIGKLLRAQSISVGIVTALPKEFAAVRKMFEEEEHYSVNNDPNDYVLGTIPMVDSRGVNLVVATLLKEMGNNSAAAAATHLLRSFPTVSDVLMVGIAGGIPSPGSPERHVRLGDVVVSDKEGIVQYDNLKLEIERIKLRGQSAKPSSRMMGIVNLLESERIAGKYPWEEFIKLGAGLEDSTRPPEIKDELYNWEGREPVRSDHPIDPSRRPSQPRIFYGRIGASNVLLKNPHLRDKLLNDCDVIAIEMEGSGIADATWTAGQRYIVIRGICDYCDEKKGPIWQGYAAVAAAAYARAVIEKLGMGSQPKEN